MQTAHPISYSLDPSAGILSAPADPISVENEGHRRIGPSDQQVQFVFSSELVKLEIVMMEGQTDSHLTVSGGQIIQSFRKAAQIRRPSQNPRQTQDGNDDQRTIGQTAEGDHLGKIPFQDLGFCLDRNDRHSPVPKKVRLFGSDRKPCPFEMGQAHRLDPVQTSREVRLGVLPDRIGLQSENHREDLLRAVRKRDNRPPKGTLMV